MQTVALPLRQRTIEFIFYLTDNHLTISFGKIREVKGGLAEWQCTGFENPRANALRGSTPLSSALIKKTKKNYYKILLAGFIAGIIVGIIVLFVSLKFFSPKKNKEISESDLIAPYHEQKTFKPESAHVNKNYRIPIITYHYVEYVKDPKDTIRKSLDIIPFVFDKELQAINDSHYQTIFVKDIPKIISGEIPHSSKSAALTFDDGYEDFYTDVFPLLKKYNVKATIFIVYDFIGRKGFMSKKQIEEIINSQLVELGAHTLDHLYLKLLPENIVVKQVPESKKILEETFKIKVESFAYPYGA